MKVSAEVASSLSDWQFVIRFMDELKYWEISLNANFVLSK